ncbi:MAG: OmpA family protein [Gammaproteobacteria bacterium]
MIKPEAQINYTKYLKSLSALLVAASMLIPASARAGDEYSTGYQYDMRGNLVRDADGNCERTSRWAPVNAIAECDPDVVKERGAELPVREKKGRVKSVEASVNLLVLQAGKTFPFDSAELSEAGVQMLAKAADAHKDVYIHRVLVAGFTDEIGDDDYNLKLSKLRADAVKAELVAHGLPEERIKVVARGSKDPLVTCPGLAGEALRSCLAPNRRVEVRFVIPVVSTDAAVELVARRRQGEVKGKNIEATGMAVNTPLVTRGFNDAVKIIGDGCSKEIANFCDDVPLGEGRVLSCLYTHNTQLSTGCLDAIVKGEGTIEDALGNANFFGAQCGPDIKLLCPDVKPGSGRLLDCLTDKSSNITMRCYTAIRDLGLFQD